IPGSGVRDPRNGVGDLVGVHAGEVLLVRVADVHADGVRGPFHVDVRRRSRRTRGGELGEVVHPLMIRLALDILPGDEIEVDPPALNVLEVVLGVDRYGHPAVLAQFRFDVEFIEPRLVIGLRGRRCPHEDETEQDGEGDHGGDFRRIPPRLDACIHSFTPWCPRHFRAAGDWPESSPEMRDRPRRAYQRPPPPPPTPPPELPPPPPKAEPPDDPEDATTCAATAAEFCTVDNAEVRLIAEICSGRFRYLAPREPIHGAAP